MKKIASAVREGGRKGAKEKKMDTSSYLSLLPL